MAVNKDKERDQSAARQSNAQGGASSKRSEPLGSRTNSTKIEPQITRRGDPKSSQNSGRKLESDQFGSSAFLRTPKGVPASKGLIAGSKAAHRRIKSNIVESLFKKVAPSSAIKQSILDKAKQDAQVIRNGPEPFSSEGPLQYSKIERERVATEPTNNLEDERKQQLAGSLLVSTPASPGGDNNDKTIFKAGSPAIQPTKGNGESMMLQNIKCLNNIILKLAPNPEDVQLRSSIMMSKGFASNQQDKRLKSGLKLEIGGVQPIVAGKGSLQVTPTNQKHHLRGSQLFDSSKPNADPRKSYKAPGAAAYERGSPQVLKLGVLTPQHPQSWARQSMMAAGIDDKPKGRVTAAELVNSTTSKASLGKNTPQANRRESSKESKGKTGQNPIVTPQSQGRQGFLGSQSGDETEGKPLVVKGIKEINAKSRENSSKNLGGLRGPVEPPKKDSKKVTPRDLQQQAISNAPTKLEKPMGTRSRKSIENPPSTAATGGAMSSITGGPSSIPQMNIVHPPPLKHKKGVSMNIGSSSSQAGQALNMPPQLDPQGMVSPENSKKSGLAVSKKDPNNYYSSIKEDDQLSVSRKRPTQEGLPPNNATPRPGDRSGSNSTEYAKSSVSQKLLSQTANKARRLNKLVHTPVSQQELKTPQQSKSKKDLVNTQPAKLTGISSKNGSSSNITQTNRSQGKSTGRTSQPGAQRGNPGSHHGSKDPYPKRRLGSGPNRLSESSILSKEGGAPSSGLGCPPREPPEKEDKTVRRQFPNPIVPLPIEETAIEIRDYNPGRNKFPSTPLPESPNDRLMKEANPETSKRGGEESLSPGVSPSPDPKRFALGPSHVPAAPPKPPLVPLPPKSSVPNDEAETPRMKQKETEMNLQVLSHKAKVIQLLKDSLAMDMMPSSQNFYMFIKKIGAGAFGKVYSAVSFLTGETVAIKCLEKNMIKTSSAKAKVQREIEIHRMMDSFHIIRLLEVFENDTYIFFVMEYADKGDLLGYVRKRGPLTEPQARDIVVQVVLGLESCQSKNVLHRDVKLDNILLTSDGSSKLCDFGISLVMSPGELVFDQSGTPAYIAPELLRGRGYNGFKADIWNLGITLYTMLTGTIPFKCLDVPQLHALILEGDFDFPEEPKLSVEVRDLIRKVLVLDPDDRLSLEEVRQHSWFLPGSFELAATKATALWEDSKIKSEVIEELETYGFPRKYIEKTLHERTPNLIHACYMMLMLKATRQGLHSYRRYN